MIRNNCGKFECVIPSISTCFSHSKIPKTEKLVDPYVECPYNAMSRMELLSVSTSDGAPQDQRLFFAMTLILQKMWLKLIII